MTNRKDASSIGQTTSELNEGVSLKQLAKAANSANRHSHDTGIQFSFEGTYNVQVLIIDGNPYFVAKDACNALSIGNVTDSMTRLDDDEKLTSTISKSGQNRKVWLVSESGLYALIFQSRKPVAKKFRKWVTSEVLPSIRKTGSYSTAQFPIDFTPRSCVVTTCVDDNGRERKAAMLYDYHEDWHGYPRGYGDKNIIMASRFQNAIEADKTVEKLHTIEYTLLNGKYERCISLLPVDRSPKHSDPIAQCERAISEYNKAKARVKDAADNVVKNII